MAGKIFWGLVILLFIGILVLPFILPSYYARQAEEEYYNNSTTHHYRYSGKSRKKKSSKKGFFSRSVRSSGGSRSYRSGK